jgi:hypothetical protein
MCTVTSREFRDMGAGWERSSSSTGEERQGSGRAAPGIRHGFHLVCGGAEDFR